MSLSHPPSMNDVLMASKRFSHDCKVIVAGFLGIMICIWMELYRGQN